MKSNAKILLSDLNGRQFIFFQNSKAALLIQVFKFNSFAALKQESNALMQQFEAAGKPYLGAMTAIDNDHYLLAAVRIFTLLIDNTQEGADNMAAALRRIADWYRYSYLLPLARGENPVTPLDIGNSML